MGSDYVQATEDDTTSEKGRAKVRAGSASGRRLLCRAKVSALELTGGRAQ